MEPATPGCPHLPRPPESLVPVLLSPRAGFWPRSRSEGRLRWEERALPDAVVHQAGSEWAASTQRPAPRAK